ncbi:phytolongin Phyl1.1 [Aristolochia californica]|uniref:phytolongin Phyl1.1 n=1 Tax=Aristolochia californica TaxID=171875 RepID=UPI0035E0E5AA
MGSFQNSVYYCCVSKGSKVLYAFSNGNEEIENLAVLCLERAPPFHIWYFETIGKRTFGFLIEDGYVVFAIVDSDLENSKVLRFLEHVRDEFKKVSKKKPKSSTACSSNIGLQDDLVPVIKRLITSLENVSRLDANQSRMMPVHSSSDQMGNLDATASTKAPLLGKPTKHDKKKMKEARDSIGLQDHGRPTERGIKIETETSQSNQGGVSSISLTKSLSSTRRSQQIARRVWWRHVWIVLAIDVVICLILFGVWLGICKGFQCMFT